MVVISLDHIPLAGSHIELVLMGNIESVPADHNTLVSLGSCKYDVTQGIDLFRLKIFVSTFIALTVFKCVANDPGNFIISTEDHQKILNQPGLICVRPSLILRHRESARFDPSIHSENTCEHHRLKLLLATLYKLGPVSEVSHIISVVEVEIPRMYDRPIGRLRHNGSAPRLQLVKAVDQDGVGHGHLGRVEGSDDSFDLLVFYWIGVLPYPGELIE